MRGFRCTRIGQAQLEDVQVEPRRQAGDAAGVRAWAQHHEVRVQNTSPESQDHRGNKHQSFMATDNIISKCNNAMTGIASCNFRAVVLALGGKKAMVCLELKIG
ncbi:hypothetical protein NDU88_004148 [Pleurodeles waltl]|uniref:Uncharacterized protein n=1 Tax=Pleurodeles waltl TaxID=8319 RepID=A0AAV7W798_PLEWA|nr:hypothetical protein NDU88_004148 [Pleurodeles waltl]